MIYHLVELTLQDGIASVRLNHAAQSNALDAGLSQELYHIADELSNRDDVKVVVLGSHGTDFSIGLNLNESRPANETDETYATVALASRTIEKWARLPHPVIAAIQGQCSSLGLSLACVADVRYASDTAFFNSRIKTRGCSRRWSDAAIATDYRQRARDVHAARRRTDSGGGGVSGRAREQNSGRGRLGTGLPRS